MTLEVIREVEVIKEVKIPVEVEVIHEVEVIREIEVIKEVEKPVIYKELYAVIVQPNETIKTPVGIIEQTRQVQSSPRQKALR